MLAEMVNLNTAVRSGLRLCAVVAAVLAVLVAVGVNAQGAPPPTVAIRGLQVNSDSTLSASVTVTDASGKPVTGLAASAFQATVDGSPLASLTVSDSADASLPLGVIAVVDTSGSMAGAPMAAARSATGDLLARWRRATKQRLSRLRAR